MTCATCGQRPAPVSGKTDKCALCRRDARRDTEALSRAIWGAVWAERKQEPKP
jgi:hypothetical protein